MNQKIIDPVPLDLLEAELTPERWLRHTVKGGNDIYIIDAHTCPNAMREVGRLREIAFRMAGGGTGLACDIDAYDTMAPPCRQLIVWDPEGHLILGGYRFIYGRDVALNADGTPRMAISHLFRFSQQFMRDFLPFTIELGRSFVIPDYQSTRALSKSIYVLDNLWDGLGALTVVYPDSRYLLGKVTMYPNYSAECRDMILYFLHRHFPDHDHLAEPVEPLPVHADEALMREIFSSGDFKADYRRLNAEVRRRGYNIPPLVNAYMSLSPTMRMFGTAVNHEFGQVEESGIFFAVDEILDEKKGRHIDTYRRQANS